MYYTLYDSTSILCHQLCIYKGWIRNKAPPVSVMIDIHRELQLLLRMKVSLDFGDFKCIQAFNVYFLDSFLCCGNQGYIM